MSIIAYPLEATTYSAEDVQSYLSTRTSGVYSEDITFTPEGMTVTVSPFLAWFNYAKFKGCSVAVTEPETLTFSPAHAVLDRIDRIALRVDFSINKAYLTVVEGVASSSPIPPDISKTEVVNDISPVYVRIKAGTTKITPADITSTILDESVCGIMRDGVTGIPTAQLQTQAEALISRLHESINSVQAGSSFMLSEVYDPEGKAEPVAFSADLLHLLGKLEEAYGTESKEYPGCFYKTIDDNTVEWINPPMVIGVEYRTTERYNGKVVYKKIIDFGSLSEPNISSLSTKSVETGVDGSKVFDMHVAIYRYSGAYNYAPLIDPDFTTNSRIYIQVNGSLIVQAIKDESNYTAKITLKYTK